MANLVAKAYIQDNYHRYAPGDLLPSESPMAEAWVESGTAVWRDEPLPTRPTAKRVTAEPGLPGLAAGGEMTGDDLVGKVPVTPERKKRR